MELPLTLTTAIHTLRNLFPEGTEEAAGIFEVVKDLSNLKEAMQRFGIMILLRTGNKGTTALQILNNIILMLEEGITVFKRFIITHLNIRYLAQRCKNTFNGIHNDLKSHYNLTLTRLQTALIDTEH